MRKGKNGVAERIELGRHIVADPLICHGQPTFKGTRIIVWQVLDDVAEAVRLAQRAWLEQQGTRARRRAYELAAA